jgi:tight adherence protein B
MLALVLAIVFLGTVLVIVAAYVALNRRQLVAGDALRERLSPTVPTAMATSSILRDERTSGIASLNRLLAGKQFSSSLAKRLERAGSEMSVGVFVLVVIVSGGVGLLIGQRLGPLMALLVAAAFAYLPILNLNRKTSARLKLFQAQLPEAIDMLVNAMKSGYSLQAAIKFAGDESPAPLGPEFSRVYDAQRLGMEMRSALLQMQDRVELLDCKMFVTALLLQRETGGNLAEVLGNLAGLMRERVGLRGQIDILTAEPKMSAVVLGLLPVALFILMLIVNRDYITPLWTTPMGRMLSLYALVSVIIGYFVLRKIGQIDI